LTSCATGSKKASNPAGAEQVKAPPEGSAESREEWERNVARSPWLVGGDYFRQKKDESRITLQLSPVNESEQREEKLKQKVALVGVKGEEVERLALEVSKSSQLFVVDPLLVQEALREARSDSGQNSEQRTALTLGEALGVQLVIFVQRVESSQRAEAEWWLAVDLVDGLMGSLVGTLRADFLESIPALSQAVLRLAREHEWSARVLGVEQGKIVIYAGRRSGLVEGDVLKVYSAGFEVVHPATQKSLGAATGEYKGKVQVVAFVGQDALVAKSLEGPVPSPKDIVKFEER
jgi:hypothetical protein